MKTSQNHSLTNLLRAAPAFAAISCFAPLTVPVTHAQATRETAAASPSHPGPRAPRQPASRTSAGMLERVVQGATDTGPLGATLRQLQPDLRTPSSFEQVFLVPASGAGRGLRFARVSGAVTAIFPASEYLQAENGTIAAVPAGTIWHLGRVPTNASNAPEGGTGRSSLKPERLTRIHSLALAGQELRPQVRAPVRPEEFERRVTPQTSAGSVAASDRRRDVRPENSAGNHHEVSPTRSDEARARADQDVRSRRARMLLEKASRTPPAKVSEPDASRLAR